MYLRKYMLFIYYIYLYNIIYKNINIEMYIQYVCIYIYVITQYTYIYNVNKNFDLYFINLFDSTSYNGSL